MGLGRGATAAAAAAARKRPAPPAASPLLAALAKGQGGTPPPPLPPHAPPTRRPAGRQRPEDRWQPSDTARRVVDEVIAFWRSTEWEEPLGSDDPGMGARIRKAKADDRGRWRRERSPRDILSSLRAYQEEGSLRGIDMALASTLLAKCTQRTREAESRFVQDAVQVVRSCLPEVQASHGNIVSIHNALLGMGHSVQFLDAHLSSAKLASFTTEQVTLLLASSAKHRLQHRVGVLLRLGRDPLVLKDATTALHAAATLAHTVPEGLVPAMCRMGLRDTDLAAGSDSQQITSLLWSCSKLGLPPHSPLYACAMEALARGWVIPEHEVQVLWALAKAGVQAPGVFALALSGGVAGRPHSALDQSHLLWACAKARVLDARVFGTDLPDCVGTATPQQLGSMQWAYGVASVMRHVSALDALIANVKPKASPELLASSAIECLQIGCDSVCLRVLDLAALKPRTVVRLGSAAHDQHRADVKRRIVKHLTLPEGQAMLRTLTAKELKLVDRGYSRAVGPLVQKLLGAQRKASAPQSPS